MTGPGRIGQRAVQLVADGDAGDVDLAGGVPVPADGVALLDGLEPAEDGDADVVLLEVEHHALDLVGAAALELEQLTGQRARAELAREVAVAAAGAAEKLLREKTNATDHAGLVDGFIRDVEAAARGSKGAI